MKCTAPFFKSSPILLRMMLAFGLGFLASVLISTAVFSNGRITADEGSYLFQAGNFLDGEWRRDPRGLGELLRYDMIVLDEERGWFSRYAPGHALWLIPGVAVGWPQLMSAVAAGISCAMGVLIGRQLKLPLLLIPCLFLISPFFLLMHGTLLSHTSGMAMSSVLLAAYLIGREHRKNGWLAVAGFAWACLFINRTWTAVWVALPFAVDSLWILWQGRKEKAIWMSTLSFAIPATTGLLLYLGYNHLMTGDSGLATYLYYEPSEKLGFGPRRIQGGDRFRIDHTPARGVRLFVEHMLDLDRWLFGAFRGALLVWVGLSVAGWSRRWSALLVSVSLLVPLGYIAFWFKGVPEVGPLYQTETLPFLMAAGALGIHACWKKGLGPVPRWLVLVPVAGLIGFSARFVVSRASDIQTVYTEQWQTEARIQSLEGEGLLFVDNELRSNRNLHHYVCLNPRGFDSRILRLQSSPSFYWAMAATFPDREPWILESGENGPELIPYSVPSEAPTMKRSGGRTRGVGRTVDNKRIVTAGRDKAGFGFWGWYMYLPEGDFEVTFDLKVEGADPEAPVRLEVMTGYGTETLAEKKLTSTSGPVTLSFQMNQLAQIEPRIHYGGTGDLVLELVTIRPKSLSQEAK